MGLLRLLLALSVVLDHTSSLFGYSLLGGRMPVQAFFIISGFYMSLILTEKYAQQNHAYRLFISNRFLRIYPIYWVALICTLLFALLISRSTTIPFAQPWYLSLSKNLFIFPTLDYFLYVPKHYGGLLVFQAWTLGLEMLFYLVAPVLVRKRTLTIFLLFLLSFVVRIYFTHPIQFYPEMFVDRFVPTEALFFLSGILSYRIYRYCMNFRLVVSLSKIILLLFFIFTIFYQYMSTQLSIVNVVFPRTLEWSYYFSLVISMPFIFLATKNNVFDRFCGNLSYPTYIIHALVIAVMVNLGLSKGNNIDKVVIIIGVIATAYLLHQMIASPIERFRQKRVRKPT